ncbi:TadE family protein [Microbacterium sp. 179-I 3D4 NHS]|uniref:TadE family protein n=1 Tax=Microbacterium sp. 179-I 3D4 NHS TaxID=3142381 RepID=UPI00399EF16D
MLRGRVWKPRPDDDGSAALEFVTVGVILLVPFVYLVLILGAVQEHALGVEAAARHTARALSAGPDRETAAERGERVLDGVADEYGIDRDSLTVEIACQPAGTPCPASGSTVTVTISATVRLPFVPPVFGLEKAAVIPVEATSVHKTSRLWDSG